MLPVKTCTVTVRTHIGADAEYGRPPTETRTWLGVNIMKTSHTRAWATRRFNALCREHCRDTRIRVYWEMRYDDPDMPRITGTLARGGKITVRRGIFE